MMIPVGYLLCFLVVCGLIHLFFKSNLGQNMLDVGENEDYCQIMGLDVAKIKKTAIVLSTIIAGVGICFYSQSYGYLGFTMLPRPLPSPPHRSCSSAAVQSTTARSPMLLLVP